MFDCLVRLDELERKIIASFNSPLPGDKAHKLMMPEGRNLYPTNGDNPRLSAVMILFYEEDGEIYFPLIKRPTYNGAHSGQMAFPGGKHEAGETLEQTALRETYEEVGISSEQIEVTGQLSDLYIPITNMLVKPFVGVCKHKPIFKLDQFEVEALHVINIKAFLNPEAKITEQWDVRGIDVKVPFFLLNRQKVWGATAMILSEMEAVLTRTID